MQRRMTRPRVNLSGCASGESVRKLEFSQVDISPADRVVDLAVCGFLLTSVCKLSITRPYKLSVPSDSNDCL